MVRPGHRTHDPLPARAILPRDPACRTAQPEGTLGRYERGLVSQTPSHLQRYTRRCAATFLAGTGFCHVWSSRRGEQTPPSAPGRHYLCALPRCLMAKVELRARELAGALPCCLRRDQPVRFPVFEHFAEVIETAIERRDIDGH